MEDRFMDEIEFAKFPNEFDVTQHLELCHRPLLLLLRSEWVVMFVKDYKQINKQQFNHLLSVPTTPTEKVFHLRSTFLERFSNSS